MSSLTEYFTKNAYKPKYHLGDRVFGRWNKIPFIGSIGTDGIRDSRGPILTVLLDLPIMVDGQIHNVIIVTHKDVKPLKDFSNDHS